MTRRDARQFDRPADDSDRTLTPVPDVPNCPTVPGEVGHLVKGVLGLWEVARTMPIPVAGTLAPIRSGGTNVTLNGMRVGLMSRESK